MQSSVDIAHSPPGQRTGIPTGQNPVGLVDGWEHSPALSPATVMQPFGLAQNIGVSLGQALPSGSTPLCVQSSGNSTHSPEVPAQR